MRGLTDFWSLRLGKDVIMTNVIIIIFKSSLDALWAFLWMDG